MNIISFKVQVFFLTFWIANLFPKIIYLQQQQVLLILRKSSLYQTGRDTAPLDLVKICLGKAISNTSGPGFDPRSGQVSWLRLFHGISSPVRQMS